MDFVCEKTKYTEKLKNSEDPQDEARLQNISELYNIVANYCETNENPSLQDFLEEVSLISDADTLKTYRGRDTGKVSLMTFHTAKGLEFPVVFLTGLEQGTFPYESMRDDCDVEEERRLAYVGVTRAKRFLYLTAAKKRRTFGVTKGHRISTFLQEIPDELLELEEGSLSKQESDIGYGNRLNVNGANAKKAYPKKAMYDKKRVRKNRAFYSDPDEFDDMPYGEDFDYSVLWD
jgi:DNA helicase-2/ATP-dependent DNA helicase PcrA